MELSDFQQPKLDLSDYKLHSFDESLQISRAAAAQLAAVEVIQDEEISADKYRQTKESLLSQEGRKSFLKKHEMKRAQILSDLETELSSILLDPSISDDDKAFYVQGVKAAPDTFKPTQIDLMVENAVMAASRADETENEHESRLNFIDVIQEVNQVKRQNTARLNALAAQKNPTTRDMAFDFAELFVPLAEWNDVDQMYQDLVGGDEWLMGSQREKLFQVLEKMPYDKRAEVSERLIEYVNEHDQIVFADGNDLIALDTLNKMIGEEEYSNTDKWIDNVSSIMEMTGILGVVARVGKFGAVARIAREHVRTQTSPTSASQLVKDANPEKARAMNAVTAGDEGEEAAEGLYGASATEAQAKDLLPEPELEPGTVENKVVQWGPEYPEPEDLRALRQTDGETYLTDAEVQRVQDKVVGDLGEIEGMRPHKESTTIRRNEDGSLGISMMYRPLDAGFKTADSAMENALFAFRNYGITEDHLTLYRRSGDKWLVTSPKLLKARKALRDEFTRKKKAIPADLKEIDYAVGIDYNYRFNPEDLKGYDLLSTNRIFGILPANLLDRAPAGMSRIGQGSLTQNLLDAASVLHPQIVNPASVAVDRSVALKKAYIDSFATFTDGYKGLTKERRALMTNYIHKANYDGLKFDKADLYARGFEEKEVELLREWRKANDYMFHAANNDMAKTLRNRGYKLYTHASSDTRLIAKPVKRKAVSTKTDFFDPADGQIKRLESKDQLDEFYEEGGTYATLSEPIQVGEDWIDIIKVDETKDGGYLRTIAENERVLNYRDGYYPVMYDANFFVYKTVRKSDGTSFEKVVASAKTKDEAMQMTKMLREEDPKAEVDFRPDRRADQERATSFDEMGWSLGVNSGISAQRVRGNRLVDASGDLHKAGMSNLHDPLEAVANQIQQLSQRVAMRNYLDATKKRWVENYAEALGLETDRTGNYRFPSSIEQIKGKGTTSKQTVADARSLFNYIYSLENGYINLIDEGFKALFNSGAGLMSSIKWAGAEKALREWGKGSMTSAAKSAVFKMFLAANPQRQLIIQAHQSVQLTAINPTYMAGGMQWDLYRLGRVMRGYEGDPEATKMYKELQNSGLLEAVDANNLVRQDTLRLADLSTLQKAGTVANKPLQLSQKYGFDVAEQFVLVSSWLAHYNLAKKAGRELTRRELDDIAGKARSFTYSMNRAGDMPYNRNSLNVIAQFLQVAHKATLQPFTNRTLTPRQRLQLGTWNLAMYGVPTGLLGSWFYDSFEAGPARDAVERGIEHVLLNELATAMTGERQQVDWGDFTPTDLHGMSDFMLGLWTTNVGEMLSSSPAGSLVAGGNPRLLETLKTTARWVHLRDDYEDPELDTSFTDVGIAAASMFSGFSNAFKAKYAYETGTKISSLGNLNDSQVTKFEAAMQFFGFRTLTESGTWKINEELYGKSSFDAGPGGDVDKWYAELKRQLARKGMTVKERDMVQRILTEGQRVFQDEPHKFNDRLLSLIQKDVKQNEFNIFNKVIQQVGWRTKADVIKLLEKMPESAEKNILRDSIKQLGEN